MNWADKGTMAKSANITVAATPKNEILENMTDLPPKQLNEENCS
jgi:hypothetical protein